MRYLLPLVVLAACLQPSVIVRGPSSWAVTPDEAAASTFRIRGLALVPVELVDGTIGTEVVEWSGTAWIARATDDATQVITAGHVCLNDVEFPSALVTYTLVDTKGNETHAEVVKRADDPDLCLLRAMPGLGTPLPLAPADPRYGVEVGYVGAPFSIWGGGRVPLYYGHYAGADMITAPTAPGASGSAVWSPAGVIGVLVRVHRGLNAATFIVSRAELVEFLDSI